MKLWNQPESLTKDSSLNSKRETSYFNLSQISHFTISHGRERERVKEKKRKETRMTTSITSEKLNQNNLIYININIVLHAL